MVAVTRRVWPRGLRGQLAMMFALVAAGPSLLAVALVSMLLLWAHEREQEVKVAALKASVEREVEAARDHLERAARELADGPLVDGWLGEEGEGRGVPEGPEEVLDLVRVASGIDLLTVQDDRGVVVHCSHLPARVGEVRPAIRPGGPRRGTVTVVQGDRLADVPALLVARRVEGRGRALTVEVGTRLDGDFSRRVTNASDARIWLMGSGPSPALPIPARVGRAELVDVASVTLGEADVRFGVAIADPRADEARSALGRSAAAVAGILVILAALLGWVLASRALRPLEELQEVARRFGHGEKVEAPVNGPSEVAALGSAFNEMVADVEEARGRALQAERVAAWQQVARRMAHEVKNPLFPIQTGVETLIKARQRRLPEEPEIFEETTRTILEEVARLSRIVTEFSTFARLPEAVPEEVDAVEVAQGVVSFLQTAHAATMSLVAPPCAQVLADRDQLHRLLLNLVKNAAEAVAPQGEAGRVLVTITDQDPRHVGLAVHDNGPGIPAEVRDKLFSPYVTTKPDGTGLGLALVHRIAVDHRAEIDATTSGEGTTFTLRWPKPPA
jgi:signal transduction histidine kinase